MKSSEIKNRYVFRDDSAIGSGDSISCNIVLEQNKSFKSYTLVFVLSYRVKGCRFKESRKFMMLSKDLRDVFELFRFPIKMLEDSRVFMGVDRRRLTYRLFFT